MTPSRDSIELQAVSAFRKHFGATPLTVASAPGRVNLIGEHTDYNDGYVLPAAIDRATAVAAGPRDDDRLVMNPGSAQDESFSLSRLYPSDQRTWTDYLTGVASMLQNRGGVLRGANMYVYGNVPRGAGLSSSAALELAAAFALMEMNGLALTRVETAKLCQQAEHEFAGVKCGIMDQFVSCLGVKDHGLFLDCRSLAFEHVPLPPGVELIICDTGVKRALAGSEYNRRREECSTGVRILASRLRNITALRDVSPAELHDHRGLLDPVIQRRCMHVVTENDRVVRSARALRAGDLSEFGKLMYDSHLSLRRDYEVSCPELDLIVDLCAGSDGVYGARMTGAGFGGCAICLAKKGFTGGVIERLNAGYRLKSGRKPSVYVCAIDDGARARHVAALSENNQENQ
ncbi:MAG TPA: galactokinase [Bacteroidota bacterium]|nr:galactokinase [Bacteroidota bacterium]